MEINIPVKPQETIMPIPLVYREEMLKKRMCEHYLDDYYIWTSGNCTGTLIEFV